MNKERKKQVFAIFVLLMFLGSSIAFAFLSLIPIREEIQLIYENPLSEQEEAKILNKGIVIAQFFYNDDCIECQDTDFIVQDLVTKFNGLLVEERINVYDYPQFDIVSFPTLILKGKTLDMIEGNATAVELKERICALYTALPEICS